MSRRVFEVLNVNHEVLAIHLPQGLSTKDVMRPSENDQLPLAWRDNLVVLVIRVRSLIRTQGEPLVQDRQQTKRKELTNGSLHPVLGRLPAPPVKGQTTDDGAFFGEDNGAVLRIRFVFFPIDARLADVNFGLRSCFQDVVGHGLRLYTNGARSNLVFS